MIGYWDRDLRNRFGNRAYYDWFGVDPDKMAGSHIRDIIGEERYALNYPYIQGALEGQRQQFERAIPCPDGSHIRYSLADYIPDIRDGEVQGFYVLVTDITQVKTAEMAYRRNEELLREVQAVANLGYYVYDMVADRWESSDILDNLFGIDENYIRDAAGWLSLVAPDMRSEMAEYLASLLAGGERFNREYAIQRANDGERRWVAGFGTIEHDEEGNPLRMVGSIQDITDRIAVERAIRQKTDQLIQSNRDLEQFASVASHDLQTPLRNVIHYAQLLERRYKGRLDAEADEFIGFIVDGGKRMTRLIADLLEYSRISSHLKPLQPVPAGESVALALRNLTLELENTKAKVLIDELPLIMAEPSQLTSLFQNLIGNSLKYRNPNRQAMLSIKAERVDEDWWRFSATDNGIGIDPQYLEKVFEIFQRLNPMSDTKGTGIGLTLCRRIVHRFGGTIWIDSTPGEGTTIYFTLHDASDAR